MKPRVLHWTNSTHVAQLARDALKDALEVYDEVQSAGDFIRAAAESQFDVILCSLPATSSDWPEVLFQIKDHAGATPVILVTTQEQSRALVSRSDLPVWDMVSPDELQRLWFSIQGASEWTAAHRECEKLRAELAQTRDLLVKNQRDIAVGRLLESIAHEINNPLEAIANLLYLAETGAASHDQQAGTWIRMAQEELQRVGEITRQTLYFHRDSATSLDVPLHEALESALVLHRARLERRGIEVIRQYRSAGVLCAHPGELRQMFANLIGNAIDAMPRGGRLVLRIRQHGVEPRRLCVTIADTGTGMPPEVLRRIGELFFTTKGESGTGIGMWITRNLVSKYGGAIRAYSSTRPERSGTVFHLCFSEPQARFPSGLAPEISAAHVKTTVRIQTNGNRGKLDFCEDAGVA